MKLIEILFLISAILGSSGCVKKYQSDYGHKKSETLRVNIDTEPPTLDWAQASDRTSAWIADNLMRGIVDIDIGDPELPIIPAIASEWSSNADNSVWTFKIRKDIKWHDGVPFTSQHILDGFEYLLSPKTNSKYAYFLFDIKNAKNYTLGEIKDFSKVGARIEGDNLIIELKGPQSYFPYRLAHHSTFPVRKDVIAQHGPRWTDPGNMVGIGPYKLIMWEHNSALVLERFDDFFGAPKPSIKYIICYMIEEYSTAIALFDAGRLDVQIRLPEEQLPAFRKMPEFHISSLLYIFYFGFNHTKPPFNNKHARKAIAHAIDKKQIVKMLGAGQNPTNNWIPKGMFGYEEDIGTKFNPRLAREELKKAGYDNPKKFPRVSIGYNSRDENKRVAENVQAQLKTNLGIFVELANQEWKTYTAKLRVDPPPIFRMGWIGDFPDPDNFMAILLSYAENNYSKWKNKEYDRLVEEASKERDKKVRRQLYIQAQKISMEDEVATIPLFNQSRTYLISTRVKGMHLNPLEKMNFNEIRLVK